MTKREEEITTDVNNEELQNSEVASNQEPLSTDSQDLETSRESRELPEKFRGKSAEDVYEAYRQLETKLGGLASEKSQKEKEAEELRMQLVARQAALEAVSSSQQVHREQEVDNDPLSSFDSEFDTDPKEAIKKTLSRINSNLSRTKQEVTLAARVQEASAYYQQQMKENADFAALEPEMRKLASEVAPVVHPDFRQSRQMIEHLYNLAKARNMDKYVKDAVDKAKTSTQTIREEKRRSVSESSSGSGDRSEGKSFDDMSIEEMQRALGYAKGR